MWSAMKCLVGAASSLQHSREAHAPPETGDRRANERPPPHETCESLIAPSSCRGASLQARAQVH